MAQTLVLSSARRGIFKQIGWTNWSITSGFAPRRRLSEVRTSTLTPKTGVPPETDEVNNEPIKFSTSQGSHRTWRVDRTMGIQHQRPWWKVLPVSLVAVGFLLWCAFREETDVDLMLQKDLYEHLPGLLPDENQQPPGPLQVEDKPTP
ncbi:ubiquinol-cytochrome-c reductase complex assembly factor 4 [Gadus macrocephalus]|uniref:ubiquinol-cytochrome-c reductase complex assembly factor 4 n=1 Tax=Gadus macrocephalus TaxID=80720 RepID=UPI0028CBBBC2|nr:ubiquinol-cytochrome-c reductase complex assembly factor 4 [Gadus macrocephalus]